MDLVERIQYIMKLNQLNVSAFADEIGVQRSSVSHVLSGRNKPSLDFVQKIIKRYPKVDSGWLLNGSTNVVPKEERIIPEEDKKGPNLNEEVLINQKPKLIESENTVLDKAPMANSQVIQENRKIKQILIFYNDNTFEEFNPNPVSSK